MTEPEGIPSSGQDSTPSHPRRALLRLPLGALGAWLAARTLAGCAGEGDPTRPIPPAAGAPSGSPASDARPGSSAEPGAPAATVTPAEPRAPAATVTPAEPRAPAAADTPAGGAALPATCARPTTFAPIADDGLRTSAIRTDQTDTFDWLTIGISGSFFQTTVPDILLELLRTLGDLRLGYPINLLEHSLQTATRARRAGASDDLVLAALFHHVGMTLSVEGYAELSAAIVRGYVSEDAYKIMRHHPEYAAAHFGAHSGEPTDQRARFASQPYHADAVRFADDWERVSYDPAYPSLPLPDFEPLIRERFSSLTTELYTTYGDCI
jgi:predicted HD phosphohydrolase